MNKEQKMLPEVESLGTSKLGRTLNVIISEEAHKKLRVITKKTNKQYKEIVEHSINSLYKQLNT